MVTGVSAVNHVSTEKMLYSDYDKTLLGLSGGAISTILGLFGAAQLQRKINVMGLRVLAKGQQRIDMVEQGKVPYRNGYIHFNKKAVDEVADYTHNEEFRNWATAKGNRTVLRHNSIVQKHNAECLQWEKATTRKYLQNALTQAKRARVKNNIVGVIFIGIAALAAGMTAYECTK